MNKSRLEAFSDGVLAIIITIMILEIKIPHSTEWAELLHLIPVMVSYFLSFLYVAIYWGNHHHLLHSVKRVSAGIIWANFNLLFWLSLIPVVTGWMGENHFAPNTVALYGINLLLSGMAFFILQNTVERHSLDIEALRDALSVQKKKGIASTIMYLSSIPLAYVHPVISGILFLTVSIMWLIPDRNIERALIENKH